MEHALTTRFCLPACYLAFSLSTTMSDPNHPAGPAPAEPSINPTSVPPHQEPPNPPPPPVATPLAATALPAATSRNGNPIPQRARSELQLPPPRTEGAAAATDDTLPRDQAQLQEWLARAAEEGARRAISVVAAQKRRANPAAPIDEPMPQRPRGDPRGDPTAFNETPTQQSGDVAATWAPATSLQQPPPQGIVNKPIATFTLQTVPGYAELAMYHPTEVATALASGKCSLEYVNGVLKRYENPSGLRGPTPQAVTVQQSESGAMSFIAGGEQPRTAANVFKATDHARVTLVLSVLGHAFHTLHPELAIAYFLVFKTHIERLLADAPSVALPVRIANAHLQQYFQALQSGTELQPIAYNQLLAAQITLSAPLAPDPPHTPTQTPTGNTPAARPQQQLRNAAGQIILTDAQRVAYRAKPQACQNYQRGRPCAFEGVCPLLHNNAPPPPQEFEGGSRFPRFPGFGSRGRGGGAFGGYEGYSGRGRGRR